MIQVRDIYLARKRLGLSQEKLGEALGVSRNTVSRWERGECSPNADKMAELEQMLDQLMEGSTSPENPHTPEEKVASQDTLLTTKVEVPPLVIPAKARRWQMTLICAGVVCAMLIGFATLIGVYSINQRLEPDRAVPAEEIEREQVDQSLIIAPGTLQPLQP